MACATFSTPWRVQAIEKIESGKGSALVASWHGFGLSWHGFGLGATLALDARARPGFPSRPRDGDQHRRGAAAPGLTIARKFSRKPLKTLNLRPEIRSQQGLGSADVDAGVGPVSRRETTSYRPRRGPHFPRSG